MLAHVLPFMLAATLSATVLLFGYLWATRCLSMEEHVGTMGMTFAFGTAFALVLANALGHFLPIERIFAITPLLLLVGILVCFLSGKKGLNAHSTLQLKCTTARPRRSDGRQTDLLVPQRRSVGDISIAESYHNPPRWVWGVLSVLIVVLGFMGARFAGSDPWAAFHFPLAVSIREGNFPPMELVHPTVPLAYHYGAALLAALFSSITGLTVAFGFNVQPLIGVAGFLLLSTALAWRLSSSWNTALLCGVLALGGGGLMWFSGHTLIADVALWISGNLGASPFRSLASTFSSPLGNSVITVFGHRSNTLGFPFLFGLLLAFYEVLEVRGVREKIFWAVTATIFALALALTMESALVLTLSALASWTLLLIIAASGKAGRAAAFARACVLGIIALVITVLSLIQGGVLSHVFRGSGGDVLRFGFDGHIAIHSTGYTLALTDLVLYRELGLPLLMLPLLIVFCVRAWRRQPFLSLLLLVALLHLITPWIVHFQVIEGDMRRLLLVTMSISSLLIGLFLSFELRIHRSWTARWLAGAIVVMLLLSSVIYVPARTLFPNLRAEPAPLFAGLPPITAEQRALYDWVTAHTKQDDYFYLRSVDRGLEELSEEEALQKDRILFMMYTGRFSVGNLAMWNYPKEWLIVSRRMENHCDANAADELNVRFLVVENEERARWFRSRCRLSDWKRVYGDEKSPPRIYERLR